MDSKRVKIQSLEIEDIPGWEQGMGKEMYADTDAEIVLVFGPNASGKSSTVRAFQQVLWNRKNKNYRVTVRFRVGDLLWEVQQRYDQVRVWKNGVPTEDRLPEDPFYHRYELSLRELLLADEKQLAAQVQQEIYGGIKLEKIREAEEYSDKNYSTRRTEYLDWKEARTHLKEVEKAQRTLLGEQDQLEELEEQRIRLERKAWGAREIEKALQVLEQRKILEGIELEREAFDPLLEKLLAFPDADVIKWEGERGTLKEEIRSEERKISDLTEQLESLMLSHLHLEEIAFRELGNLSKAIAVGESERKGFREQVIAAESELKSLSRSFGYGEEEAITAWPLYRRLENFRLVEGSTLEKLISAYHHQHLDLQRMEAEEALIRHQMGEEGEETSQRATDQGISTLIHWVQEHKTRDSVPGGVFFLYVIVVLCLVSLLYFRVPEENFYVALMVGVAVLSVLLFIGSRLIGNHYEKKKKKEFGETGLRPPDDWTITGVLAEINTLFDAGIQRKENENFRTRLLALKQNQSRLAEGIENRKNTLLSYKANIGAALDLSPENMEANVAFVYLTQIRKWQECNARYKAALSNGDQKEKEWQMNTNRFNQILERIGLGSCETTEQVTAIYAKVEADYHKSEVLHQQKDSVFKNLEAAGERWAEVEARIREAYAGIGKEESDKFSLWHMLEDRSAYKEVMERIREAQTLLNQREKDYHQQAITYGRDEDLTRISYEDLQGRLTESTTAGQELEEIKEKMTSIRTKVETAMGLDTLERAIRKRDETEAGLKRLFEENLSARIGHIILQKIRNTYQREFQPEILRRAGQLLLEITRGRYHVTLVEEGDQPVFMGWDTVKQRQIPLSELSSGTRIHLLMALRLASIEEQEDRSGGWRMPLFADELLANTDGGRAPEVIRNLIEISQTGRQIFYFTARPEEIKEWQYFLDKSDAGIEYRLIHLPETSDPPQNREYVNPELPDRISLKHKVPYPVAVDKEEYRELLKKEGMRVPSFDLISDEVIELHVWYLTDDMETLHRFLQESVRSWGQLEALSMGDKEFQQLVEENKMKEKILFLRRYMELYRTGRPRYVDRKIFLENGVTSTKLDSVMAFLKECHGDLSKTVRRLDTLEGIGRATKEKIEENLRSNGFLPEGTPLTEEEIISRLQLFLEESPLSQNEAERFLNEIVARAQTS